MFRAANRKSIGKAGNGWHFRRTMDELVHDLVSALEESSEQAARGGFGDGGEHALNVGCLLKRQARKRRGRKRRSDNPHPPWETAHLSEGSESSVEEHKVRIVSTANNHTRDNSDSDEQLGPKRRTPQTSDVGRSKRPLWPDDPGVLGSAEGTRSLRRRRKVKRMAVDPPAEPDLPSAVMPAPPSVPKARAAGAGPSRKNRMKKRKLAPHRLGAEAADEGVVVESEEPVSSVGEGCKDKMELEEHKGSDEEMSDSSVSNSSDGGLYTNDEGRQGDDEQSDWFCEGEPGSGSVGACGVAGVIPWWESDACAEDLDLNDPVFSNILTGSFPLMSPNARRGFQARLSRLHGHPRPCNDLLQGGSSEDVAVVADCSSASSFQNVSLFTCFGRQTSGHLGSLCMGDVKRRRKAAPLGSTASSAVVGESALPIPDTNLGNRMLQSMGWTPGVGLGPEGRGITEPIRALQRPKGTGLGFN
uniref:G patch domain containing 2 n=1 Tax=Hippocampus comes TaxID=109280 RepID=A0A3Q2YW26_HIPCM